MRLKDGAGLRLLLARIETELEAARAIAALAEEVSRLGAARDTLVRVTRTLLDAQVKLGPERALGDAVVAGLMMLDAFVADAIAQGAPQ